MGWHIPRLRPDVTDLDRVGGFCTSFIDTMVDGTPAVRKTAVPTGNADPIIRSDPIRDSTRFDSR